MNNLIDTSTKQSLILNIKYQRMLNIVQFMLQLKKDIDIIKKLCENDRTNINCCDHYKTTPLIISVRTH